MSLRWQNLARLLPAACLLAAAAACTRGTDDLQAYIDEVKARPGGRIEPLPEVRPAPRFVYEPAGRRSPFVPDTPQMAPSTNPNAARGPDTNRPREFLEQFSLDTLRMVGTMNSNGAAFGLVQTSDGLIHRVTVGNHVGQNYGRILTISDSTIELVEVIPDGIGGYIERPAAIGLSD
jgi:type IV pilus assembly protein PilP